MTKCYLLPNFTELKLGKNNKGNIYWRCVY